MNHLRVAEIMYTQPCSFPEGLRAQLLASVERNDQDFDKVASEFEEVSTSFLFGYGPSRGSQLSSGVSSLAIEFYIRIRIEVFRVW